MDERKGQVERPTWQVRDGRHTVPHNELAPLLDKILDKDGKIPVSSEDETTKTERLEGVDTTYTDTHLYILCLALALLL